MNIAMWNHMQGYRKKWYRAKAAVEENDRTDASPEEARVIFHISTEQWVFRLLPLDEVEDAYPEIWHERQFGPYTGLRQAHEDGLSFEGFDLDDPLSVDLLTKIGKAAEEMTVHVMDLPEQPPVDVDPWSPSDLSGLPDVEEKL